MNSGSFLLIRPPDQESIISSTVLSLKPIKETELLKRKKMIASEQVEKLCFPRDGVNHRWRKQIQAKRGRLTSSEAWRLMLRNYENFSLFKAIKKGEGEEGQVIAIQETESHQTLIFPRTFESIILGMNKSMN